MATNHALSTELLVSSYGYRKLHEKHEKLEKEIKKINLQPYVDIVKLKRLKKEKLAVADCMFHLT